MSYTMSDIRSRAANKRFKGDATFYQGLDSMRAYVARRCHLTNFEGYGQIQLTPKPLLGP